MDPVTTQGVLIRLKRGRGNEVVGSTDWVKDKNWQSLDWIGLDCMGYLLDINYEKSNT